VHRFVTLLRSIPRQQIALIATEENDTLVYIYGPAKNPGRGSLDDSALQRSSYQTDIAPKHMNLLFRIDFRHNEPRKKPTKSQRLNAIGPVGSGAVDKLPSNNLLDNVDIRATSASLLSMPGGVVDSRDWSKGSVGVAGTVYPSDRILRDSLQERQFRERYPDRT
jgi:hypothetical protein